MEIEDTETGHVISSSCSVYGNSTSAGELNCAASFEVMTHREGTVDRKCLANTSMQKQSRTSVLLLMLS